MATQKCFYRVHVVSAKGGDVRSSSAVTVATRALKLVSPRTIDTLLIAGGEAEGLRSVAASKPVRKWVLQASARSRRFGSVCTGAFILGHFGLIAGKRIATHWAACSELARRYPDAHVDSNALYIADGRLWTSAGVTTGIDMCLEMVALDLGNAIANAIAKRLVLYARRPGYQSQFSPMLTAQTHADAPFADLIQWIREHLPEVMDVPRLAARVAMSDRTFHRKFTSCIGETPAHFVETLRLDQARHLLGAGMPLKEIAAKTGYSTAAQLSKAFDRRFAMSPALFRKMHRSA